MTKAGAFHGTKVPRDHYRKTGSDLVTPALELFFIQPGPQCPLIQSTLLEFVYKGIVRDSVEFPAEVRVDNNHCSPLVHPGGICLIAEGSQVGQA